MPCPKPVSSAQTVRISILAASPCPNGTSLEPCRPTHKVCIVSEPFSGQLVPSLPVDCYKNGGQGYSGSVASSESGSGCQQWSNSTYLTSLFPALVGSRNYCRNPGGLGTRPWCFTDKGRMEYCSISQCKGECSFLWTHPSFPGLD